MLLLGHWPALAGADARLFELRPVAGIDGSSLMGHRVGSCAFSPITLVDSAIPIISVLEPAEEPLHGRVVRRAPLPRHRALEAVPLADLEPPGPPVVAPPVAVDHGGLARPERCARLLEHRVGHLGVGPLPYRPGDRHPVEAVDHGTQVRLAGRDPELRHVGEPEPVGGVGAEVARDEVPRGVPDLPLVRVVPAPLPGVGDDAALLGHELPHLLAGYADGVLPLAQPLADVAVPPAPAHQLELLPDGRAGPGVGVRALGPGPQVVVAARRDAQGAEC